MSDHEQNPMESRSSLKARWERRAVEHGMTLSGVLYRGLPEVLNDHLHRWHADLITTRVLPRVLSGGRVLDRIFGGLRRLTIHRWMLTSAAGHDDSAGGGAGDG